MGSANKAEFKGIFTYTDEVLSDFEAMYRAKTSVSPVTRLVLGLVGAAFAVFFIVMMILKGFSVGFLVPAITGALVLLLSLLIGHKKADSSVERYRKHYLNKKAHVQLDDSGVELKLNGQKSYARSKFRDVYSLLETDKTLFLEIKGRAFYILPKDGMDGSLDDLKAFLQKKCAKRFQYFDLNETKS